MNPRDLFAHVSAFVDDFLPENLLQLLFPLGTFLLLIGSWHSWLPPGHTFFAHRWQSVRPDQWFDASLLRTILPMSLHSSPFDLQDTPAL